MKITWIIITLLFCTRISSQDPAVLESVTQELVENGFSEEAEEQYSMITSFLLKPLELNSCSVDEIGESGLFTPFQAFGIMQYREKYGPFFSIYELAAIPGINRDLLEDLEPLITFSPRSHENKVLDTDGRLLTGVAARYPKVKGLQSTDTTGTGYLGDALKYSARIRYEIGENWIIGTAYEKDVGETWGNQALPEHFTAYATLKPAKIIDQLIVGNYRIQRGMGLVHGIGFNTREPGRILSGYRRSFVKPFASTMEYAYFRGACLQASRGKWNTDLFFSVKPEDISLHRYPEETNLFKMTRETGLHRTTVERGGAGLARQWTTGFSVNRSGHRSYLGCSVTGGRMDLTKRGMDSLSITDPLISNQAALSMYGVNFSTRHEVFGEAAFDHLRHLAFLVGGTFILHPALTSYASFSRIAPGYSGFNTTSSGNSDNETFLQLGMNISPLHNTRIRLYQEYSGIIDRGREAKYEPPGYISRAELIYGTKEGFNLTFRYSVHYAETTKRNGMKKQLRIHYRWPVSSQIELQGRIALSTNGKVPGHSIGSLAYQQLKISPVQKVSITYRFLLFNIDQWENRIYAYEPGVRYSFHFPAFHGNGSRMLILFSVKAGKRTTLRWKFGWTTHAWQTSTGSGNDLRDSNRSADMEFQLEARLF